MDKLVALVFCVGLVAHGDGGDCGDDDYAPRLLHLSDSNFEHDTQAASGQTTGIWLVLFAGGAGDHAELPLRALLSKTKDGVPLFAKVDVHKSPKTAKRFSATNPPVLKLFRDRQMFTYSGDWSQQSIQAFYQEGWTQTVAEVVPKEAAAQLMGNNLIKIAALALGVVVVVYLIINATISKRKSN